MFQSFIKPFFSDTKTAIVDLLFPIYCLSCEKEGPKFICEECKNKLIPLPHQFCIVCQKKSVGGLTHPNCQSPHMADGLISIYDYHDPRVANILIKGKYSFLPQVYKELGQTIANKLVADYPLWLGATHSTSSGQASYKLTAIPLHRFRKNWRGFNQSQVLCESMAEVLGLPVANVLVRKKFTKTQKDLKKDERIKNVESAFALSPAHLNLKSEILNHVFLLVDDVTTTGSTLLEAAKVLKRNGAAKVYCLTVARD